jgi:DNA polymerase III subunit epsilon
MTAALPVGFQRALARMRASGEALPLAEVARRLLASRAPIAAEVARRVVATALGHDSPAALPAWLEAHHLRPAVELRVASVPLRCAKFAVVDLETTGVAAEHDAIIEIGAVRVARLEVTDHFETLVRPPGPGPLSSFIVSLTGIHDALLRDAPLAAHALARFRQWMGALPDAPFVAHNASFDARFTWRALAMHRLPALDVPVLCTRKLARRVLPGLPRYDLDHLCAHFRIPNRARHRALGDAEATARALIALLGVLLEQEPDATLGDLLDLQARAPSRRR